MSLHSGYLWSRLIHLRGLRLVTFLLATGGVFAVIAASIRMPWLIGIDRLFTAALQEDRSTPADILFYSASFLGNSLTLILADLTVAAILFARGHRRAALLCLVTLLSLPLDMLIKNWAVRPRPEVDAVLILMPRVGMSFPSGHAMGSTAVYGFCASMFWLRMAPGRLRAIGTAVLALLPVAIGLSRIYVGAHWLSDVLAGMAAGAFLLVPLIWLYKQWHQVASPSPSPPAGSVPDR